MDKTCWCMDAMRTVSRNGFIVIVRSNVDRPEGVGLTCVPCGTRYVLVPAAQAVAA